ncbi:MAG: phosphatase PAP2 family protein [Acidimicrobiales bacterium]
MIDVERALGLYHEETIQRLFLSLRPLMKAFNVYYGTAHFAVTAGVLMWLFVHHPDRYPRWRWSLACTTLLGLVGFMAFPLMPPRLISPAFAMGSYVDTLQTIGGLWNFEDGPIARLSNQYAAMPSLHFAWSLWCCLALWPRLRSRWARGLALAHPLITLVAIVATANHYWIDALAGALTLLGGWLIGGVVCARAVTKVTRRHTHPAPQVAGVTLDLDHLPRPGVPPACLDLQPEPEPPEPAVPAAGNTLSA